MQNILPGDGKLNRAGLNIIFFLNLDDIYRPVLLIDLIPATEMTGYSATCVSRIDLKAEVLT